LGHSQQLVVEVDQALRHRRSPFRGIYIYESEYRLQVACRGSVRELGSTSRPSRASASLADPVGREFTRIDLVLATEGWSVTRVAGIGDQPFRAAPPTMWASDHFGMTARIVIDGPDRSLPSPGGVPAGAAV
jgi:hypothetical protein